MKKIYGLFTFLLAFSFGNLMAQGTGLCSYNTPDSVKQEILSLPHVDGKCIYLLVLEDTGGDGWDGASIDVSVAEAWPAENYKVTPADTSCVTIPLYVEDGETIDLTYWNGANVTEHSFYLYDAEGKLALDENGNTMAVGPGIPANQQFRVKAQCPYSGCDDEQIMLEFNTIATQISPIEPIFWEIRDSNGDIVYNAGPTIEVDELDVDSIFLNKCEQYMIVLGSSIGTDWNGVRWELLHTDPNYGTLRSGDTRIFANDSPASSNFVDGMLMYDLTVPCIPAVPSEPIVITGGDPATCMYGGIDGNGDGVLDSTITLPLIEPVRCYPQMQHMCCDGKAVNVAVTINPDNDLIENTTNNDILLGEYEYDDPDVYCDGADGVVVDTNGDGIFDGVELDFRPAFPEGIEAGSYTVCYEMTYNCQEFGSGNQIKVNNCATIYVTTISNPILACNDLVNVSLNYSPNSLPTFQPCQTEVTPDMVLEDFSGCSGDYVVNIFGAPTNFAGEPVNQDGQYVTATMAGGTYDYTVTHIASGNKCWGQLTVEDKEAPILICNSYEAPCNHPNALDLVSGTRGYSETTEFCIDQEQAIKVGTVTNNFSDQLTGGNQIAFPSVGCTPHGEVIKRVRLTVEVEHTRPRDIVIHLVPPVASGVDTIRVTTQMSSTTQTFNINYFSSGDEIYSEFAGDWQILLTDVDNPITDPNNPVDDAPEDNPDDDTFPIDPGYGSLISACLSIEHGYPDPYERILDCNGAFRADLLVEEMVETDCDQSEWYGLTVRRVWQAVDDFGNASTCVQSINLLAPTFDDIIKPADAEFECGTLADEENPDPSETGLPRFDCFDVIDSLHHSPCDISYSYEDQVLPTCGNGKKIIRTWTFVAWCTGVSKTHEQIIKIEDMTGPTIDVDAVVMASTEAYDCNANVDLMSAVTDGCSGVASVTASYIAGGGAYNPSGSLIIVDVSNGEVLENLPFGPTEVQIVAKDSCLNETIEIVTIDVFDGVAPVAICNDDLHVSLGADGTARIFASDFDEGSYDNCGDVTLKIGNSSFFASSDSYEVRCNNIGEFTLYLHVEDEAGNKNICWADIHIEDALPPVITCPEDKTLECNDAAVHNPFGTASALDNCTVEIDSVDGGELDQCYAGTLTRTWTASDGSDKSPDVSCTQRVTVNHVSDFIVQFPDDRTLDNCEEQDSGMPEVSNDDCELIAISADTLVLDIVEDACYKLEITWTVINWCIYDQDADNTALGSPQPLPRTYQDDGDGYFQYTQTVKILDDVAPVIDCPGDQNFCDLTEDCEGYAELILSATDACSPDDALEYTYKIDAFNDNTFDIVDEGNDASGVYPHGTHKIKWIVEDGCGNTSSCEYLFTIEDCKNPTPVCLNGITIENMQTGCVEVWASDLLEYAFDNCTERTYDEWQENAKIRREGDISSPQGAIELCCEDVGTVIVEIWVEDEAGNADYCTTYIIVQDNLGNCDDTGSTDESRAIAGGVRSENGENVEDVTVDLTNGMVDSYTTGSNGSYMFPEAPMHDNYTLTPAKDMNPTNGVSTFDLVLISQHVLGQSNLNSPYKMIAADVNNDGNISTFDVVQLRQLILSVVSDFTDNTSWRFIDGNYMFPNPQNPWMETFPEVININNLATDELSNDFIAVKVGDVDGNAQMNSVLGAQERNAVGTLKFQIDDTNLTKGQSYTVDFLASDFTNINGYQFTLNFDAAAMNFAGIQAGALNVTDANFGLNRLNEGVITTSWNIAEAKTVANDEVLFSITFDIAQATTVSEALNVTSRYTNAEAYNTSNQLDVALTFNTTEGAVTAAGEFELFQNTPNPFNGETVIGFNLPTASTATLKIYDVSGRTLKVVEGEFNRGYNQVTVDGSSLNAAGVLYYQLDTPDNSATMKMILLD